MPKKILILIFVMCFFDSFQLIAQVTENKSTGFWDNLKIQKGFESLDDKSEPAAISITLPKHGENSYLINAGIMYNLVKITHPNGKNIRSSFSPFFDYNLNTLIDKPQNNYKLGVTNSYYFGKLAEENGKLFYWFLDNSLSYQRDKADTSHSIIVTSYLSFARSEQNNGLFFNVPKPVVGGLSYLLSMSAGPEYQYKFNASDSSLKGGIGRLYGNLEGRIMQRRGGEMGNPFLELRISFTVRKDILNSTGHREGYLPLFVPEVLLYRAVPLNSQLDFLIILVLILLPDWQNNTFICLLLNSNCK